MSQEQFNDAWLDTQYLKLDEGVLAFVFTRERLDRALEVPPEQAAEMLKQRHDQLVSLYARTTHRILHDEFYTELFEELADLPDDVVIPFVHLALRNIEDEQVEAARVEVVAKFQSKRKKKS
jgi:lipoate-protein ligase A